MHLLPFLLAAFAAPSAQTGQPVVEVFLPIVPGMALTQSFSQAQRVVDAIYSEIGIRVVWKSARTAPAACTKQPLHAQIVVVLKSPPPDWLGPDAMAFSNPYSTSGPCVTVLMDRVKQRGQVNPLRTGYLLGHVLAHEMGHVLQGVSRHSETGIMKANWSLHETARMWWNQWLHFTSDDAELVLLGLRTPAPKTTSQSARPTISRDQNSSRIDN